jgi:hypothetical protein
VAFRPLKTAKSIEGPSGPDLLLSVSKEKPAAEAALLAGLSFSGLKATAPSESALL